MITSLRNNANLRLGRKKYFTKENPYLGKKEKDGIRMKHVRRTSRQIEEFHIKEIKRKRRETRVQIIALLVSASLALLIVYLIFGTSIFT